MPEPILRAQGLSKRFGPVEALRGVDFSVSAGEIVALVGDNGAGKSTLIKILIGEFPPTTGRIEFLDRPRRFASRREAQAAGIEIVYQDLAIAPHLEPSENFFLARELFRFGTVGHLLGILDREAMRREMRNALTELGIVLKQEICRISDLSGGEQQSIVVARAAHWASRLLFLDEPTAALGVRQTKSVHDLMRRLRDRGVAIVFVSHDITEVIEVSDRIHVLRRGETAAVYRTTEVDPTDIVRAMTGAA